MGASIIQVMDKIRATHSEKKEVYYAILEHLYLQRRQKRRNHRKATGKGNRQP
jgi:hypothetical protein